MKKIRSRHFLKFPNAGLVLIALLFFYWLSVSEKISVNIDMSWNEKVQTIGQLFWSEGSRMDQFGEDRSFSFEVLVGRKFYQIDIPSYTNSLRIDPAMMPGSLSIHRISTKYFGWTLKHWDDATSFLEWQNLHDLKTFKITESEWVMQSLSKDPYLADLSLGIGIQVVFINACLSFILTIFVALLFAFAQWFTPNFLTTTDGLFKWFNESPIIFLKIQNCVCKAEKISGIVIAIICTLFVAQLGEVLRTSQTPFVWTDSWDYFLKSTSIYSNPSFQTVTSFGRPLFCWWIPLLASWSSVPMRLNELIFYNNLTSFLMFFCGLILFCRNIKLSNLAVLWILCLVLTIPIESLLSQPHGLMGDFYLSGYILLAEGALQEFERSKYKHKGWGLLSAIVIGGGIQVKPIFLFWILPRIFFSSLVFLRNEARPRIPIVLICITIGITVFLFPTGLLQFMKMQYLYNEVLQNHQNNADWLWYPQELSKLFHMSLLQFLIVGVGLVATLVPWARLRTLPIGWRSKLLVFMKEPCLMTIVVCGSYLTFFVVGKDFRTTQFLFFLSVAWIIRALASRIPSSMYVILIIATTIPTFLVGQKLLSKGDNFATFERFGYDRLFQAIVSDHELRKKSLGEKPPKISAFFSVFSNEFNDSLSGYQNARCGLSKDKHLCPNQLTIDTHSAPFARGSWGYPGGFPKEFFSDDYVVLMFPHVHGGADTVDVYNPFIQEKIIAGDPAFLDGLTHVTDIKISNGKKWILFRRDRIPSQSAFVQILKAAMNRDPENIWNEPWRLAVKKIEDPNFLAESSPETERRTILLSQNHITPEFSTWGVWLLEILRNSEKSIREAKYPAIISADTF